jgi:hypothetical protein
LFLKKKVAMIIAAPLAAVSTRRKTRVSRARFESALGNNFLDRINAEAAAASPSIRGRKRRKSSIKAFFGSFRAPNHLNTPNMRHIHRAPIAQIAMASDPSQSPHPTRPHTPKTNAVAAPLVSENAPVSQPRKASQSSSDDFVLPTNTDKQSHNRGPSLHQQAQPLNRDKPAATADRRSVLPVALGTVVPRHPYSDNEDEDDEDEAAVTPRTAHRRRQSPALGSGGRRRPRRSTPGTPKFQPIVRSPQMGGSGGLDDGVLFYLRLFHLFMYLFL